VNVPSSKGIARLVFLAGALAIGLYLFRASPRDVTLVYDFGRAQARSLQVEIARRGRTVRNAEFHFPSGAPGQVVHRLRLPDGEYSLRLTWRSDGGPRTAERPLSIQESGTVVVPVDQ
jgi:hypothetical protein